MNLIQSYEKDGRVIELFQRDKIFIIKDNKGDELSNIFYMNLIDANKAYCEYVAKENGGNDDVEIQTGN